MRKINPWLCTSMFLAICLIVSFTQFGAIYQSGLTAGVWKGQAMTYSQIMDQQTAVMRALK